MKKIKIISMIMLLTISVFAQNEQFRPRKIFRTWIKTYDSSHKKKGALFSVGDSTLMVSTRLEKEDYQRGIYDVATLHVKNIDRIRIRKKNNVGKWIGIGAATGLAGGILFSFWWKARNHGDLLRDATAVAIPIMTTAGGICIGAIIGSVKISIPIHGKQNIFDQNREKMVRRSLKYKAKE
jgi:hypothetical protein